MTNKPAGGGSDNKINQIILAVITTILAPVIVFFITDNYKNSAVPTPIIQVITATAPAIQPTQPVDAPTAAAATAVEMATNTATVAPTATVPPTATITLTATQLPTATDKPTEQSTEAGITNPSGTIAAGTPVLIDGLVLTISAQDVIAGEKSIIVRVHIKNPGSERRTLTFTPGSITLKDDTGHIYAPLYGDKKTGCKRDNLDDLHVLEIAPQEEVILVSTSEEKPADWCAVTPGSTIPLFTGPLSRNAKKLGVQINGLGSFRGFQVEIDL